MFPFDNRLEGSGDVKITKKDLHRVKSSPNDIPKHGTRTLAMQALLHGHGSVVKRLVEQDKINFFMTDNDGQGLIHYAVKKKDKDLILLLIKKQVSINARDKNGRTPFFQIFNESDALSGNEPDLSFAEWLIEQGADANVNDKKGNLSLHIAAKEHDVNVVSFLLEVTKFADKPNYTGVRPLHYATENNNLSVVQKLLHYRADVLATDNSGKSILHHALENNKDKSIIGFLLQTTDSVRMLNEKDIGRKQTPFQLAVLNRKMDVVHQMVELGADINKKDGNEVSPLTLAVRGRSIEMVEMLLSFGADISNGSVLYDSISTNMYANAGIDSEDLFNVLMEYSPDVDAVGDFGETPLMRALEYGRTRIVERLLREGADPSKVSDEKKNVLFFVSRSCPDKVLREMIKKGADVNHKRGGSGETVLQHMISEEFSDNHIKILVENGADVNVKDFRGVPLLYHVLMYSPRASIAEWLIDNGAEIPSKMDNGTSILHMAGSANGAHVGLLKKILDKGGDINQTDMRGNTALHCAVRDGIIGNVKFLLDNGADPDIENTFRETPVSLARSFQKREIKKILQEHKRKKTNGLSGSFGKNNKKGSNDNKKASENKKPPNKRPPGGSGPGIGFKV